MTKTLAYTTEQRSADLTFATCSCGPDLDPDIHILARRAVAFRRYFTRQANKDDTLGENHLIGNTREGLLLGGTGSGSKHFGWDGTATRNGKMVRAIYRMYSERKEPGIYKQGDKEQQKAEGGDPTSKARAALRKRCRPLGPIGFLLESIHRQAAPLDPSWKIIQFNQQPIDLVEWSAHLLNP